MNKKKNIIKGILIIFAAFILVFAVGSLFGARNADEFTSLTAQAQSKISFFLAPREAKAAMPLINCYCGCGGGMKISECACEHGEEMRKFVNEQAKEKKSKREILAAVAQKYGMKNIREESEREAIRAGVIEKTGSDRPQIVVSPQNYDFGEVNIFGGKVKTKFNLKNNGGRDLIIKGLETSCMCTEAFLIYEGKKSPKFGMEMHHGGNANPKNFKQIIVSGESAEVEVVFDPLAHGPDATGAVTRTVTIYSDDPIDPEVEVNIEAKVVK